MAKASRSLSILASMLVKHVERGAHSDGFFYDPVILGAFVTHGLKKHSQHALLRRSGVKKATIFRLADERLKKKKIDRIQQDKKIVEQLIARLRPFMFERSSGSIRRNYF